ncbi:MAG: WD40/YVTN/BNR-like repeat-containing protein [Woeseiaceae bacterium]
MKKTKTFLVSTLLTAVSGTVLAQDFSSFEYRNIGPSRGGRVTAVAGTVAAPATFYLGASGGGVWKTEDYGTSWNVVSDDYFETPSIGDIAVAQNDANIVYVGTGSDGLRSNVIAGKGVYKSIDGGDSWEHIGLRETGQIGAVEIDPTDNNIVWVAAIGHAFNANEERGVYKTVDGGRNWERMLYVSDTVGFSDVELLPGNPNVIFATAWKAQRKPWTIISGGEQAEGGLFKSVDGGVSWERITDGLPTGLIGKIDLAVSQSHSNIVYALVEAPDDEGGLFKSVDQGKTFEQVSSDSTIRTRPFYYANIEVDPQNPDVVYSMATLNKKSVDGGKTWERLRVPHEDNHDMWINPDNPDLFIQGNDGGANVTHNGGKSWSTQFNQPTAELYTVEVDDQYPYYLYAGQQDNGTTIATPSMPPFRAQDPAAWLVDSGGCETGPAIPKPGNHNIVYAECKGRFFVFDKRIGTEKEYAIGAANIYGHNPRDLEYRFQRVAALHLSPHNPDKVYMGSQYVHVTTDGGETWETISPDLTAFEDETQVISGSPITRDITGEEYYSTLYSIRESSVQAGVIWTGSNDGPVHVTQDNGENWEDVTPRGLPPGGRVDSVEPSPHNAAKAYISVLRYQLGDWRPHIYKTEDFGRRWEEITDGIPDDFPVRVVREDTVREGLLFAGTEWGMFVSLDDGESWQEFQQNLGVTPITDMKIVRGDLAISTMGRSFWVLDSISTLRDPAFDMQGEDVLLFQPNETIRYRNIIRGQSGGGVPDYPPPAAIIDYYIPEGNEGPVRLEVLDANGDLVNAYESGSGGGDEENEVVEDMQLSQSRVIVNENLSAESGVNRFRWDMKHFGAWDEDDDDSYTNGPMVRPGDYTIRLTAGATSVDQQLTLLVDPRVLAQGTSLEDIDEQVAMQLVLIDMLSDVRQFQQKVEKEQDELESRSDDLSPEEAERLLLVTDVLNEVKDAEIIYPKPMLARQISFLLNMINRADQAPGVEAADRLTELSAKFADLQAQYGDGD